MKKVVPMVAASMLRNDFVQGKKDKNHKIHVGLYCSIINLTMYTACVARLVRCPRRTRVLLPRQVYEQGVLDRLSGHRHFRRDQRKTTEHCAGEFRSCSPPKRSSSCRH